MGQNSSADWVIIVPTVRWICKPMQYTLVVLIGENQDNKRIPGRSVIENKGIPEPQARGRGRGANEVISVRPNKGRPNKGTIEQRNGRTKGRSTEAGVNYPTPARGSPWAGQGHYVQGQGY